MKGKSKWYIGKSGTKYAYGNTEEPCHASDVVLYVNWGNQEELDTSIKFPNRQDLPHDDYPYSIEYEEREKWAWKREINKFANIKNK